MIKHKQLPQAKHTHLSGENNCDEFCGGVVCWGDCGLYSCS